MKQLRQLLGLLGLVLGITGMLVCLVLIVGAWFWSFRLRDSVDQVADRVTTFTTQLSDRTSDASDWLTRSQGTIAALEENVAAGLEAALENSGVDPAEVESVMGEIRAAIAELREWLIVAESSGAIVELIREVTGSLGALVSADSRGIAAEALEEIMEGVRQTGLVLDELSEAIEQARLEGVAVGRAAQQRTRSILSRSAVALASLQEHTDAFGAAITDVEDAAVSLRAGLRQRLTVVLVIATVLLVWQAVAQWSLARWGGGAMARRT